MATCRGKNALGFDCNSSVILEGGYCPAHSGTVDMAERGRRGGVRSGEAKRLRRRTLAEVVADRIEADADPHARRVRAAIASGNLPAALAAVRMVMGVSEETAVRAEMEAAMRDRRANARATGERWRQDDDYDEEF